MVLLHGWGTNARIWCPLVDRLAHRFELYLLDLPGHGHSAAARDFDIARVTQGIADAVPAGAVWMGWSLGGLVGLAAAVRGLPVSGIVVTGTSPRFTTAGDWPHATSDESLDQFATGLMDDWQGTLRRFLALQSRGSERSRDEIRFLRSQLLSHGPPDPQALSNALQTLRSQDLRDRLPEITVPVLIVHGQRDALVPAEAALAMAARLPNATLVTIPKAAHAPFLSHADEFAEAVLAHVHE
jgi:pimeloyl-[acyl-carrier protein] methyl ester esterase